MNSILPLKEENISGLNILEFIPVSHVSAIDTPWQEELPTTVTLHPGKTWMQLAYSQETGDYSCVKENSVSGAVHKFATVGFTPKMKLASAATLNEMQEDLFIVRVKDNNGNVRLCGTIDEPVRFDWSETTLPNFGGRPGYSWHFYRDLTSPPPYYTA